MDLNEALGQFDLVDANLRRLESAWERYLAYIPQGVAFADGGPEARAVETLRRGFDQIAEALPPIDGWRITATPLHLNEIARMRLEAQPEVAADLDLELRKPGEEIAEYRFRFNRSRQLLVRERAWGTGRPDRRTALIDGGAHGARSRGDGR